MDQNFTGGAARGRPALEFEHFGTAGTHDGNGLHLDGNGHARMLVDAGLLGKPSELGCWNNRQEAHMDDEAIKRPKTHEVGMPIDTMSVEELTDRIALLEGEIQRIRAAITARGATRQAAESMFKF